MSDEQEMQIGFFNPSELGVPGVITSVFAGKSDEDGIEPVVFMQIMTQAGIPVVLSIIAGQLDDFLSQVKEMAEDALKALENPQPIIDRELNKLLNPNTPL